MSITNHYPLNLSPNSNKFKFSFSPNGASQKNLVYEIRNQDTGDSYVGSTERALKTRMDEHACLINQNSQGKIYKVVHEALKANQKVYASILEQVPSDQSLSIKEKEWIRSLKPFLNSTSGGRAKKPKQRKLSKPLALITPEKSYPFKKQNGKITVDWTHTARKADGAALVYRIKNRATGACYVGQTIQPITKRIGGHLHLANHPEKKGAKRSLLQDLNEAPEDFSVGIVAKVPREELDAAEKALISIKNSYHAGYNGNQGNLLSNTERST